jgi:hypothetical protein
MDDFVRIRMRPKSSAFSQSPIRQHRLSTVYLLLSTSTISHTTVYFNDSAPLRQLKTMAVSCPNAGLFDLSAPLPRAIDAPFEIR